MNPLAMFQTIINEIPRDFINIEKVVSFMNNIMVRIESEKGYNELVEEILEKIKENDLYIKLQKYKWYVREVEFLEVVIGPEQRKKK